MCLIKKHTYIFIKETLAFTPKMNQDIAYELLEWKLQKDIKKPANGNKRGFII